MSSYFPGRGRKKPMNQLEAPVFPDIKKGPPRFIWTKKHWTVDTGRTMAEIEHIPQMLENSVLYQSYDYNSQHAYGKYPTYDVFVNKEFRPPLIDRDDILPLSRIPRPVVGMRINPGSSHPSGNSSFSDSNMHITGIEKNISDRVKSGEIRPTFFAPIDMPTDNSVLPDLETTLPPTSASAGFRFPSVGKIEDPDLAVSAQCKNYKQFHPSVVADVTPIKIDFPDAREGMELDYNKPQISGHSGYSSGPKSGLTPIDMELEYSKPQVSAHSGHSSQIKSGHTPVDYDLEYNKPQISGHAGRNSSAGQGLTPIDLELYYTKPQISAHAGSNSAALREGLTPIDLHLDSKLVGSQPAAAVPKMTSVQNNERTQDSSMKIGDNRPQISYVVPSNTRYQDGDALNSYQPYFHQKATSIGSFTPQNPGIPQNSIPRAGVSAPQIRMRLRKDT